jgi:NAD(P)H-dependent FMN reductase
MLPIADPAFHKSASEYPHDDVVRLDALARAADAFVLSTPVYHNSYSGVLKNMLDLLNIEPHFRYKPVGLVSNGGDRSSQAVDHLRIVARGLNAVATPTHVCTHKFDFVEEGEGYRLVDEGILQRVDRFARELLVFALLLRPVQHEHAVQALLNSIPKGAE